MAWNDAGGLWYSGIQPTGPGTGGGTQPAQDTKVHHVSGSFSFRVLLQTSQSAERTAKACKVISDNDSAATGYEGATVQRHVSGEDSIYGVAGSLAHDLRLITTSDQSETASIQVYGFVDDAPVTSDVAQNDGLVAHTTDAWDDTTATDMIKAVALEAYESTNSDADIFILI